MHPTTYTARNGKVYPLPPNAREKFLSKVDKTPGLGPEGECWHWKGKPDKRSGGYGKFCLGKGFAATAHRISHLLFNGDIPRGYLIRHKCDNGICVRPDHLEVGLEINNMRDKYVRGRSKQERGFPINVYLRVHEIAKSKGIGPSELATRSGVPLNTLSRAWRNQVVHVELGMLGLIADVLEVSPGDLLGRVA